MFGTGRHIAGIMQQLPANRLLAIDAFRGLTITAMILVNNPGSWQYVYPPLLHAEWHGWTPTDLIFPFFLFIVGISLSISVGRQMSAGNSHGVVLRHAAVRTLKLIGLGWFLALFYYNFQAPDYDWLHQRLFDMRIPGVLQRIGVVYLFTVGIFLLTATRGRVLTCLGLLIGYYLLMTQLSYSDAAGNQYRGLLEHGNSLAAWLDHKLFGPDHVYYPKAQPFSFDPEGALSTLPSIASCLTGVLAGQWLMSERSIQQRTGYLLLAGGLMTLAGLAVDPFFPINKPLWTSSYVLLTSGLACIILAICLFLIDIRNFRNWTAPFVVFGANSIAFYMFAGVVARLLIMIPVGDTSLKHVIYRDALQPVFGNLNGSLVFALLFLVLSYGVMHQMYKRGIFWKV